jgi:hypothetical protein
MYSVKVFKKDRRTKAGERLYFKMDYNTDDRSMLEHVLKLTWSAAQGFRVEVNPTNVVVKNLMSGEDVTIRAEDRGGPCDPSMERYWSM